MHFIYCDRQRVFSFLFFAVENEPFTELLVAYFHSWPQHVREKKIQIGLALAAIVRIHKQTNDTLKPQNGLSIYPLWPIGNWPTRIDPIGFPVTLTATKDRAAMIKPIIATPS